MKSATTSTSGGGGSYAQRHFLKEKQRELEAKRASDRECEKGFELAFYSQMGKLDAILSRHKCVANVGNTASSSLADVPEGCVMKNRLVSSRRSSPLKRQTLNHAQTSLLHRDHRPRTPSRSSTPRVLSTSGSERSGRSSSTLHRQVPERLQQSHSPCSTSSVPKVQSVETMPTRRVGVGPFPLHKNTSDSGVSLSRPNLSAAPQRNGATSTSYVAPSPVPHIYESNAHHHHSTQSSSAPQYSVPRYPKQQQGFDTPFSRHVHSSILIESTAYYTPNESPPPTFQHDSGANGLHDGIEETTVARQHRSTSEVTATTIATSAAGSSPQNDAQREEAYLLERELLILASRKAMMEDELRIMQLTMAVAASATSS